MKSFLKYWLFYSLFWLLYKMTGAETRNGLITSLTDLSGYDRKYVEGLVDKASKYYI